MIEILVLLALLVVGGVGLWLALVVLRRTLKWMVRVAIAAALAAALVVGFIIWFFWWSSDSAPRKQSTRPPVTKPRP